MTKFLAKTLGFALILVFGVGLSALFSACSTKDDGKIDVVCTVFPQYDWARAISQNSQKIDVDLIVKNGSDLHSYFSTSANLQDTYKIKHCDILIYCGGESEATVEQMLSSGSTNKNMTKINLLDILKEQNLALAESGEEDEFDEHVWLSLNNAKLFANEIASAFMQSVPEEKELFSQNLTTYITQLDDLNAKYENLAKTSKQNAQSKNKTPSILVADRFPFAYLVHDMGLNHKAAFSGCSAETNVSLSLQLELADFADAEGLDTILVLEGNDKNLANAVKEKAKTNITKILELNSMQGVSQTKINSGTTYLKIMQSNLTVLSQALEYLN